MLTYYIILLFRFMDAVIYNVVTGYMVTGVDEFSMWHMSNDLGRIYKKRICYNKDLHSGERKE